MGYYYHTLSHPHSIYRAHHSREKDEKGEGEIISWVSIANKGSKTYPFLNLDSNIHVSIQLEDIMKISVPPELLHLYPGTQVGYN